MNTKSTETNISLLLVSSVREKWCWARLRAILNQECSLPLKVYVAYWRSAPSIPWGHYSHDSHCVICGWDWEWKPQLGQRNELLMLIRFRFAANESSVDVHGGNDLWFGGICLMFLLVALGWHSQSFIVTTVYLAPNVDWFIWRYVCHAASKGFDKWRTMLVLLRYSNDKHQQ